MTMICRSLISRSAARAVALILCCAALTSCERQETPAEEPEADRVLAERLLAARLDASPIDWLAEEVPTLTRADGFRLQKMQLDMQLAEGASRVGWKMGGTRITDPAASPDPIYGYVLSSNVFDPDVPVSPELFVDQTPLIEAEVAIVLGEDLPGPEVTREELIAAIDGIAGAIEIVSPRLPSADAPPPPAHLLADNVAHAGALVNDVRIPVEAFDFDAETVTATIDGEEVANGSSAEIMGTSGTPLDAALWLANALPKHGMHLRAGEFILTGSLYDNPSLLPGQTAEISFSSLGNQRVTLENR